MKNRLFILACIAISIFTACQKEPDTSTDGFGASNKELTGTPLSLPAGVSFNGSIRTSSYGCSGNSNYVCSSDGTLPFYMSLRNDSTRPATVIFPAGMVIPSTDTTLQGAVIVQPDTIIVPAGSNLCVILYALCVNEHRTFSYQSVYAAPLISHNAALTPLVTLLATKQIVTYDPQGIIQQAVWDIANTGQMTAADIAAINNFP